MQSGCCVDSVTIATQVCTDDDSHLKHNADVDVAREVFVALKPRDHSVVASARFDVGVVAERGVGA